MSKKKRHWLWNVLIVLTLVLCFLAFLAHYKNWHKIEEGELKIMSGIYYQRIPLNEIDSLKMVEKVPELERSSGFSWMVAEKGVFIDSITDSKVHFFVDDLAQQKVKLVHHDSLLLFINFKDSLQTQNFFENLQLQVEQSNKPN
ncbi:hypothetical protein [Flagellimonas algicola]|uniref:PH (Pleckstrin Homology) domain-containing protein n=1 Tax=Flagellimonas algicola TaxID=2583815 RepID=A0ABY2WJ19_9FLAO|nr:hypothetical protein [Allomuricauda algicola]TMU54835.1 hypothetical protein FGG15_11600 [Allomuricauda algicola]